MIENKIMPLVSIIIPTYNHAKYLGRSLQSVINQTYENWEVIIIDNHSTDDTSNLVNNYTDQRIKYLKIHNDGIIAKSRNLGIKTAKGNWIAFLDSDDWWSNDKLKICMSYCSNSVDLIYHQLQIQSNKTKSFGRKIIKTRKLKKPVLVDLLFEGNAISNSSVVVKKDMLEKIGFIEETRDLVGSEDYNTWIKISTFTDQFLYLPNKLGYYFMHDKNTSKKNMSIPYRHATYNFLSVLSKNQKIKLEANIRYLSGRFNYLNLNYKQAKEDLFFTFRNGFLSLKIKALFMIIIMILN